MPREDIFLFRGFYYWNESVVWQKSAVGIDNNTVSVEYCRLRYISITACSVVCISVGSVIGKDNLAAWEVGFHVGGGGISGIILVGGDYYNVLCVLAGYSVKIWKLGLAGRTSGCPYVNNNNFTSVICRIYTSARESLQGNVCKKVSNRRADCIYRLITCTRATVIWVVTSASVGLAAKIGRGGSSFTSGNLP